MKGIDTLSCEDNTFKIVILPLWREVYNIKKEFALIFFSF